MLSTRTKQVFSYGRRNRRIINDKNDLFDMRDTNKSSAPNGTGKIDDPIAILATPKAGRKRGTGKRVETMVSPSPTGSPPMPLRNCPKKKGRENDQVYSSKHRHSPSSARRPLSSHSVNVSRRSSLSGPKKLAKLSESKGTLVPKSPDVNMDIIIIDEAGRRVSQERRVSKTNVQVNQRTTLHPGPTTRRHATATNAIVVSDSDDSDGSILGIERRAKWWRKVSSSSDEEDCVESPIRSASSLTSSGSNANRNDPTETAVATDLSSRRHSSHPSPTILPKTRFYVEIVKPRPPRILRGQPQELAQYDSPPQPLRSKPRQLTPIRRKGSAFPHLPPSPSTITDSDISIDLANFTLSSTPIDNDALPNQPPHLIPLLDECGQEAPVEFSAFIEAFPVHPIVRSSCSGHATFQKIGEASYSEVFGIGDVVLKIIPIRNEEGPDEIDAETPAPSDAKDVLKEIVVTRAMGEMCNGFVNLLKTYVIRGKYPSLLLDLWDEYNQTKGSESVRPGATPHVPALHLSLNLTRHVGRVTGVRYNRFTQWWPGSGSILVQPTCQDGVETGL
jgi:serine/threonine-protein kinase haspin